MSDFFFVCNLQAPSEVVKPTVRVAHAQFFLCLLLAGTVGGSETNGARSSCPIFPLFDSRSTVGGSETDGARSSCPIFLIVLAISLQVTEAGAMPLRHSTYLLRFSK